MRGLGSFGQKRISADRFVVIDCETTGLSRTDRVVEVAAVTLDGSSLEVVDEYDTLINPQRDVGPVNIHGVTASMVEAAPTFDEVGAALGSKLDGAVLVAHNLQFDARMLSQEFERIDISFDAGEGICTLAATHEKLIKACRRFGVALEHQHRALADARATATLFARCLELEPVGTRASVNIAQLSLNPRTLRRDAIDRTGASELARVVGIANYPTSNTAVIEYLDMLDWVLDDLVIDDQERQMMSELAQGLGLSSTGVAQRPRSTSGRSLRPPAAFRGAHGFSNPWSNFGGSNRRRAGIPVACPGDRAFSRP